MSKKYTLDSFALLAWLQDEKGAARVDELIAGAGRGNTVLFLCVVNLGEIYYINCRERGATLADHALTIIENLPLKIMPADKQLALKAAEIKANFSLAYADAFAAGLGIITDSLVVTGDPEFNSLEQLVDIEWLEK